MISLRKAVECVGLEGDQEVSVWRDLLGYLDEPGTYLESLSVEKHIKLLDMNYIDLDIIQVGIEDFDRNDRIFINVGIAHARLVFGAVSLGIRLITHSALSLEEAGSLATIKNNRDYKKLVRKYRGPGPGLDVFMVEMDYPTDNGATQTGVCRLGFNDNKDQYRVNGCVVQKGVLGRETLAHEIGHGLGLCHQEDHFNLMTQGSKPIFDISSSKLDGRQRRKCRKKTGKLRSQVTFIFNSDWIREGCDIETTVT